MRTKQETFLDFLGAPATRLVIPVYQRVYAWGARQCDALWADTMRAGRTGSAHFLGTMLYATEPDGAGVQRDLIDGQQRAATLTLLLAALRDRLREGGWALEGIDAEGISARYLHVADAAGAPGGAGEAGSTGSSGETAEGAGGAGGAHAGTGKLVLSRADRATLDAIVAGAELPGDDEVSENVVENYRRFRAKMGAGFSPADAEALWRGLGRLFVITAELDDEDRPQLVFESLNSKGMPLTTADLVRSLVLVNAGYEEQTRLYDEYWAPIERLFGDDPASTRLNAALHGWLAVCAPQLRAGSKDEVYSLFKTYLEDVHQGTLEELLRGLKGFCETFAAKSQSSGAARAQAHASWANGKVEGIISEKKLFGD